jgi:phosphoribosyl-ATP pyrophosphohydrolase
MKKASTRNRTGTIAPRQLAAATAGTPLALNGRLVGGIHIAATATHDPSDVNATVLEHLAAALGAVTATTHPRTYKLLQSGRRKLARKVIEEACEVTVEAVRRHSAGVVRESADLLYHLIVLWFHMGVQPIEIWQEMQARADALGIAEKLPKATGDDAAAGKFNRRA